MLVKKSNILMAILSVFVFFSGMTLVKADRPIIFKVINNTDYTISIKAIRGVLIQGTGTKEVTMDSAANSRRVETRQDPEGLQGIAPGEEREQKWDDFAPGINKLTYSVDPGLPIRTTEKDYGQTAARVRFTNKEGKDIEDAVFEIAQKKVGADQTIGNKVKVGVRIESQENWVTFFQGKELYYNYTITFN